MSSCEEEASQWPKDFGAQIYTHFFEEHDLYERYHIHLVGVRGTKGGPSCIADRKNRFGKKAVVDTVADPYVEVETVGSNTGSKSFFPIGYHKFPTLRDTNLPIWDDKCLLIAKKDTTSGIKFKMADHNAQRHDEILAEGMIDRADLPEATSVESCEWKELVIPCTGGDRTKGLELVFNIKVSDGSSRVNTKETIEALFEDTDNRTYSEYILKDDTEQICDNSVLQCWKQPNATKAILWVLGRNDCFMHPHAAQELLFDNGYDVYVLNYKMNGCCRQKGFVENAHMNSHNTKGNFDVYNNDLGQSIDYIKYQSDYSRFLGYAHSTGAPILLNYLMQHGDKAFDGFIFNSPFLDWGFVGGDMVEFALKRMDTMQNWAGMAIDKKLDAAATPEPLKDRPIRYLQEDIVISDWSARVWSLHYFDWGIRPLYKVPMTVGFAIGVTNVHKALEALHKKKRCVTAKPFLVITSRGDDTLKAFETLDRADWIGPARSEIELNDNGHDVFLSSDKDDTDMAIDMVAAWMKNKRF